MGDQNVSRYEFDLYREGQREVVGQLRRDLDDAVEQHDKDIRELRSQRETDQTSARASSQHDREWTWTRKIGLFMAAIALAGLELQYLAHR